ncbi:MAG: DUF3267 domain-containing protein [Acidobacteria bacterium]|nr:DUF3267 domain-containing protein [Acidobacteriota bacterium]
MLRFILRLALAFLGFPGVILHEFGHQLFCWLTGTRVLEVRYLRVGVPAGYVLHERPASVWRHALIACGPFVVNSGAALGAGWALGRGWPSLDPPWLGTAVLIWLGLAAGMHAFPSLEDATGLLSAVWEWRSGILAKVLLTPLGALMVAGAFASWVFLDLAWAAALVFAAPSWLARGAWPG